MNTKAAIDKLLDIVGYNGDKEKTAAEFLKNCQLIALAGLMKTLDEAKKEALKQEIKAPIAPEKVTQIITKYFGPEQFEPAILLATANYFKAYFQTILPSLNESQKENLKTYLEDLVKTPPPPSPLENLQHD